MIGWGVVGFEICMELWMVVFGLFEGEIWLGVMLVLVFCVLLVLGGWVLGDFVLVILFVDDYGVFWLILLSVLL